MRVTFERLLYGHGVDIREVNIVDSSDLVVISKFRSVADAEIAKGLLDQAGIASMIRSDNAGGMYPALAGADLIVRAEDVSRAEDALAHGQRHN